MHKIIFLMMMTALSFSVRGQFVITGRVYDSATNQVLPGANLKLQPSGKVAVTDQFGNFRFENVSSGTFELKVTYVGYEVKTQSIEVSENQALQVALNQIAIMTDAVVVTATRATDKTPTTFTTVGKETIQQQNFGQDVPYLLNWTPSVVTTSDAGTGIGYTGIRIRGSDPTRINVTINGIPYNDSESLGTFWVDVPDISTSTQSIQVQRGVGSSTNGAGAFGGTVNLQTSIRNDQPYAEVLNSAGSFNTRRHTLSLGTGLLNGHWVLDGRVSRIESDGFIDRAFADLRSHYFSAGFYTGKTMLKAVVFGGKERTYQAWYGVPESRLKNDAEAMEVTAANEGWNEIQTENLLNADSRTFNPYIYENEVDDYQQDHYQLHFSHEISENALWNTALHYTKGKGFYEQYNFDDNFSDYGLPAVSIGDSLIESADIIRRRWLDNDFYGLTFSLNYEKDNVNVIWGGGANRYEGDHFGEIIWSEVSTVPTGFRYYFNHGDKKDLNTFIKANYQITQEVNLYADLQYRTISYVARGVDNGGIDIDIDAKFNFFNPKLGLTYTLNSKQQAYVSGAIGNREPVREDFIGFTDSNPEHERLSNIEIGFKHRGDKNFIHANYYLMDYKNQLVLTGELNDVGAYIRTNAGNSYRMGIEIEAGTSLHKNVQWNANLTVSRNKIEKYTEVLEDYGDNFDEFNVIKTDYHNTDIAFSPNVIAGSQLRFTPLKGSEFTLLTKYVGKQFLDNTSNEARVIDSYVVNDLRLSYTWRPTFAREIVFSLLINNILDEVYESNGYTWGYLAGSATYRENYFFPQAGRNYLGMIAIKL
jgi:iron complex outermembrane recepter protein